MRKFCANAAKIKEKIVDIHKKCSFCNRKNFFKIYNLFSLLFFAYVLKYICKSVAESADKNKLIIFPLIIYLVDASEPEFRGVYR